MTDRNFYTMPVQFRTDAKLLRFKGICTAPKQHYSTDRQTKCERLLKLFYRHFFTVFKMCKHLVNIVLDLYHNLSQSSLQRKRANHAFQSPKPSGWYLTCTGVCPRKNSFTLLQKFCLQMIPDSRIKWVKSIFQTTKIGLNNNPIYQISPFDIF